VGARHRPAGRPKEVTFRSGWEIVGAMSPHRSFDTDELVMGLRTARIGLWAVDLTTHEVRWTSEMEELFGFETGSFPGTLDAVMDVVHPDDRARVLEEVRRHIRDRSVEFAVEYRI